MPNETEIQRLLRLKRYEQPPPEYFQSFLQDFQRRQRSELLRQPLWRIAADRVGAFLSEHSMPRYAYGMATSIVLAAGVFAGAMIVKDGSSDRLVTKVTPPNRGTIVAAHSQLAINGQINPPIPADRSLPYQTDARGSVQPRYVIDARPVSYEPATSF